MNEKFTISVSDQGVIITGFGPDGEKHQLCFNPVETIMLMDILQNEEPRIRRAAENLIPLSLNLNINE